MNIFEKARQTVSVPEAAMRWGLEVGRGGMVKCPFHPDSTPSMKLYEDHYYCFGCGANGDVVNLTAKLLNLSNLQAAQKLTENGSPTVPRPKPKPSEEGNLIRIVNQYIRLLHTWQDAYPLLPGQEPDGRFVEAMQMLSAMEDLSDFLQWGPKEDREKIAREMRLDGRLKWLEDRLNSGKENHHD